MTAAVTPPLTLGEILDRTIQIYRRNFLLFAGISLAPSACYVLTYGSASLYFTSHAAQLQGTPNLQLILTIFGIFAGFLILGVPLLLAISSLSLGALNFAATLRNSGQPVTIRAAYAYAFKKFWRYLGIFALQLLFALVIPGAVFAGIIVIGSISAALLTAAAGNPALVFLVSLLLILIVVALFVAMILIWLRFSLAFPASFVEDLKIWPSMQRSNLLSKGSRGRIFVMYLLVAVLVGVLYYALILPVDLVMALVYFKSNNLAAMLARPPLILQVINLFIGFLQRAFTLPIYAIALVLFYNDQRTRHEGYDIELLMAQAGWSTAPQSPAPEPAEAGLFPHLEPPTDPASATFDRPEAIPPETAGSNLSAAALAAAPAPAETPAEASSSEAHPHEISAPPPEAPEA